MRLIDADALSEAMYHEAFETDSDMQRWDSGCWIRYKMFENAIKSAPTIDPVKRGKWEKHTGRGNVSLAKCNECGFIYPELLGVPMFNFCPNCGMQIERSEK